VGRRGEREADRVDVVRVMAAYIDLNPVRAELVSNSKDYPFCGYGEACAGEKRAQRGLCRVVGRAADAWEAQGVERVYENLLSGVDWETGKRRKRKGKREKVNAEASPSPQGGGVERQSLAEMLRHRVRAFSESLVLGSQEFVEEVFQANRSCFGPKRKEGARRLPQSKAPLYVARRACEVRGEYP
jgi:hypothetical protein